MARRDSLDSLGVRAAAARWRRLDTPLTSSSAYHRVIRRTLQASRFPSAPTELTGQQGAVSVDQAGPHAARCRQPLRHAALFGGKAGGAAAAAAAVHVSSDGVQSREQQQHCSALSRAGEQSQEQQQQHSSGARKSSWRSRRAHLHPDWKPKLGLHAKLGLHMQRQRRTNRLTSLESAAAWYSSRISFLANTCPASQRLKESAAGLHRGPACLRRSGCLVRGVLGPHAARLPIGGGNRAP